MSSPVTVVKSRLTIGGKEYEHRNLSCSQELVGDLPESVAATGGFPQTDGSVEIRVTPDATDRVPSPFSGYGGVVPPDGSPVTAEVDMGDGKGWQTVFRGKVDSTSAKVGEWAHVDLIDSIDAMRATFSTAGLLSTMPPAYEGDTTYRYPAPTVRQHIYYALRAAGYHITPPSGPGGIIDVPGQGSFWPSIGRATYVKSITSGRLQPHYADAPWGVGMADVKMVLVQSPESYAWPGPGGWIMVSFLVGPSHAGDSTINVIQSTGTLNLAITITADRTVKVQADSGTVVSGSLGSDQRVTVMASSNTVQIITESGFLAGGDVAQWVAGTFKQVEVTLADTACVAGIQVANAAVTPVPPSMAWRSSARIRAGQFLTPLQVTRNVRMRSARETLDEICKATLTAMWIDRQGIVQLAGADVLYAQDPRRTYSTTTDIRGLGWNSASRYARRAVQVGYTPWTSKVTTNASVQCWQGDGSQMTSGQNGQQYIDIPAEQLWIEVDHSFTRADSGNLTSAELALVNRGVGSVMGTSRDGGSGGSISDASAASLSLSYRGLFQYQYVFSALKDCKQTLGDEVRYASTARGQNLPIIRARGYAEVANDQYERVDGGPEYAAELTHDLGIWGSQTTAAAMAQWLSVMLFKPRPILSGFEVPLDPELEVGQVIDVESMNLIGVTVRVLVTSVAHDFDSKKTTVSGRQITIVANRATYDDLESAWAGADYQALENANAGNTYAGFEAYPTKGSPNGV